MPDYNRVILAGRVTFDPELKRIPSGTAVCELRMVTNKRWSDKNSGDKKEKAVFFDVTVWGAQAENVSKYLRKGSNALVEGSLDMDQWDDKTTGEKRSKLKVVADNVIFLDSKPRDDDGPRSQGGNERQPQAESRSGPPQGRGPAPRGGGYNGQGGQGRTVPVSQAEVDDDLPF